MALSDEQNAMLRLLASGEQGYGDIAALLGLSEDEVRAKVVGALAQLQAEGKLAPNIPPPIPGGAKPAAEVAPPEPEPPAPAAAEPPVEPVVADAVAPKATPASAEPKPAASKPAATPSAASKAAAAGAGAAPPTSGSGSGGRTVTLPTGGRAWLLGGGVLVAIAVIVVVLLVSGGSSDNSSSTASTEGGSTTASENGNGENGGSAEATQAELVAVDGSEAVGRATFGRLKNKLALQIEAKGLEATTATNAYTIWLAQSPQKMLPLASTAVKGSGQGAGQIAAQFEVPVEILAYLASGTFDQIAITRTVTKPFEAAIKLATENKSTPKYTGEEVLRGTITGRIVGLAKREEEEQKGE